MSYWDIEGVTRESRQLFISPSHLLMCVLYVEDLYPYDSFCGEELRSGVEARCSVVEESFRATHVILLPLLRSTVFVASDGWF